jgi:RNA polymerase sigma-70 factor (ECF subfamily)
MDEAEIQLVKRAQAGDSAAFTQLVHRYDRKVLLTAQQILNDIPDSQDVYQETFIRAFRHLSSFRYECQFGTWLMRIAINTARTRLRQRRVRQFLSLEDQAAVELKSDPERPIDPNYVRQQVGRLPAKLRIVVTLKYFQGYKIKEIAEMMQCQEGTVKNYLFRAVEKLRTLMKVERDE